MATPDHTPHGRGYQTAMNYFHHDNDYWAMTVGSCATGPKPKPTHKPAQCDAESFEPFCLAHSPESKLEWTATAGECCTLCQKYSGCGAFAWGLTQNAQGLHACHMKSEAANDHNPGNCTSGCKYEGCLKQGASLPVVDLWMKQPGMEGPARGFNSTCWHGQPPARLSFDGTPPVPL